MPAWTRQIHAHDRDGYRRGGVAYPVRVDLPEAACPGPAHVRVTHPDGRDLPIQLDILETWPDGSVRAGDLYFPLHLPAGGEGTYTAEADPDISSQAPQPNPVDVDESGTVLSINQGPVTYTVRSDAWSVLDTAVFNRDVWKGTHPTGANIGGPKPFLRPGSPPPTLRFTKGETLAPNPVVSIAVETAGPRTGRVRIDGAYSDSLAFTSLITFYSGVSWYRHTFTLEGDTDTVDAVVFEDRFDLGEGPLTTAFGARVNSHGSPTNWAVVTDGVSTVDIAAYDAWSAGGYVRYESETDGTFRVIAPWSGRPVVTFYHFLITPPADHYHTPAPAMVADPHISIRKV